MNSLTENMYVCKSTNKIAQKKIRETDKKCKDIKLSILN